MSFVFLVGMPGVGKTYWGKELSTALSIKFLDLDNFIEFRQKATIPELFASLGEDAFRELEHEALMDAISYDESDLIIACGGGTPCFYGNMELMKSIGTVLYLQASIYRLLDNLSVSYPRPLLENKETATKLQELMDSRNPVYEQADLIINVEGISNLHFEKILELCIKKH